MAEVGPAEYVRRLLEDGVADDTVRPVTRVPGRAARTDYLAQLLGKAVAGWVVRSGGWRRRDVALQVQGRPRLVKAARAWDQWGRLDLTPGPASMELAARLAERASGARDLASVLARLRPATQGDHVAFHLLLDPLWTLVRSRVPLELQQAAGAEPPRPVRRPAQPPARRTMRVGRQGVTMDEPRESTPAAQPEAEAQRDAQAILAASPLTALVRASWFDAEYCAQDQRPGEGQAWERARVQASARFRPLVEGDRAALLTWLDDHVARHWLEDEETLRTMAAAPSGTGYLALACAMDGLTGAASEAGRLDATQPIMRFFERFFVRLGRAPAVAQAFQQKATTGTQRMSDRQRFTFSVAALMSSGMLVSDVAEDAPQAIDRSAPDQVFLGSFRQEGAMGDLEGGVVAEVDEVRRTLAEEVG